MRFLPLEAEQHHNVHSGKGRARSARRGGGPRVHAVATETHSTILFHDPTRECELTQTESGRNSELCTWTHRGRGGRSGDETLASEMGKT